jgi:CHAT domain-containing protein
LLPTGTHTSGGASDLPFENYKDVPWLIRTHAITHLPTVASLGTLRTAPAPSGDRLAFAGFGDPWFSKQQAKQAQKAATELATYRSRAAPVGLRGRAESDAADTALLSALPRLPDTAAEVMNLAKTMNADIKRDVFLGKKASEEKVRSSKLSDRRVVVFATHGLVPGDLNGLVESALALSAPEVTGGKADGLLTLSEILSLNLDADWVVLSACNTGSASGAGAEAVSGLGRAFFYAGTRAVLVSHWPVETTSARRLTTELFRRQSIDPSLSRAAALQQSTLQLIDDVFSHPETGAAMFSYAHPIFWAPLALIGDGGV